VNDIYFPPRELEVMSILWRLGSATVAEAKDALDEPLKRHNPKRDGDGHELKESLRRDPSGVPATGHGQSYFHFSTDGGKHWKPTNVETSSTDNPGDARRADSIRRASASQVRAWMTQLSPEEAERVHSGTDPLWRRFYADGDW